ncbi:MAG: DNA polymerase IV [Bacillota bacterium]|nr:DNA polymerase IV [Bacillota bacterium]
MKNIIAHIDMDAFYASIEVRDNPKLKGKPVLVGGKSNRGVVATCSYEARKYGIKSAMPVFIAKKKCPNCIIIRPNHSKYSEVSKQIFNLINENVTDKVEKISIDEGYLDLSEYKTDYMNRIKILKELIKEEIGITFSIGISYNKFLAKIASDWNKPDGFKIIKKEEVPDILKPLNISKVHGIGQKSKNNLNNIGIYTIGDLLLLSKDYMVEIFGKHGLEIYDRIRGIDLRKVEYESKLNKSVGKERTLKNDTKDKNELKKYLYTFSKEIVGSLDNKDLYFKTIVLKYKTKDFETHTKSKTINVYSDNQQTLYSEACKMLDEIQISVELRLIGLSVSNFVTFNKKQLSFFE